MRKVLHILYSGLGGHASVFFSLVRGQRSSQTQEAHRGQGDWEQAGLFYGVEPVVPDYLKRCATDDVEALYVAKRRGLDRNAASRLDAAISQVAPEAIIVHVPQALGRAVAWRRRHPGCRVVMVEHHPNQLKSRADWWRSARGQWQANTVVFLTPAHRDEVAERLGRLYRPDKAALIPNGLDMHYWQPANTATALELDSGVDVHVPVEAESDCSSYRLGMCTRLSEQKDIDTLLRAFAALRGRPTADSDADDPSHNQWQLEIAGDGPQRRQLEALAVELGIEASVNFAGMLDEKDLLPFYQSLDLYVHATCAETMSTSVMQALACGLPVVASDIAGMDTLVPDGIGLRVKPRQVEALAGALSDLMFNSERRGQLGRLAREFAVDRLSCEVSWQAYRQCLD